MSADKKELTMRDRTRAIEEMKGMPFDAILQTNVVRDMISQIIPSRMEQESFVQDLAIVVNASPDLMECTPVSVIIGGLEAKRLNLSLSEAMGHAHLVPYNNRKTHKKEAQFQIGYKGLIQLALRSGAYSIINATEVREGELDSINYLTGEHTFSWLKPNVRGSKPVIGYAALVAEKAGYEHTMYMSLEDIKAHAKTYSTAYQRGSSGPWKSEFDKMAMKTILKQLLGTYAIIDTTVGRALQADQAVVRYDDEGNAIYDYVDNLEPSVTDTTPGTGRAQFEAEQKAGEEIEVVPETGEIIEAEVVEVDETPQPSLKGNPDSVEEVEESAPEVSDAMKEKLAKMKRRGRPAKVNTVEVKAEEVKPEVKPEVKVEVEPKVEVVTPDKITVEETPSASKPTIGKSNVDKIAALRAKLANK